MYHILINQQKAPSNLICIGHLHDDSQLPECFASFPVISRVKSEARFQALTRFADQLALCIHM